MGITGAGKTTFIQQFCEQQLNIGHNLQSCTNQVEVVPCYLPSGRKIFLIDTPGFDDTYRSDTDILREVADWLSQAYQYDIKLTGIIYLHRISDVRIGGSGMKNLRMFRKLCGERGLRSVVLATTMWSLCPPDQASQRENQLVNQNDLWKYLTGKGARVFRQDDGPVSGYRILDYLVQRASPVILEIQHEMVNKGMKLSETGAGKEVQEELEKLKERHEKEMREIREEMTEAMEQKDEERQAELRTYKAQLDRQMYQAAEQARTLERSREELRREMQEQHSREIQSLRSEIDKKQEEIMEKERTSQRRHDELRKELQDYKDKVDRQEMTNRWKYNYDWKYPCPQCGVEWLYEEKQTSTPKCSYCNVYLGTPY
jgi:hypothetical protein